MLVGAFKGAKGGWTTENLTELVHQPYVHAFRTSIEISLVTALIAEQWPAKMGA